MQQCWGLVALWLIGCAPLDDPPPPPAARSLGELQQQIRAIQVNQEVPALVAVMVDAQSTTLEYAQTWSAGDPPPQVTVHTPFRAGSVTKPVLALALLLAAKDGVLDLGAPLHTLVGNELYHNPYAPARPLTITHVLEHSDGLDDSRPREFLAPPGPPLPLHDVLAMAQRSRAPRWAPGSRHAYGNPGFTLAGYALERATGERFETYVARRVLAPLGMAGATVDPSDALISTLPTGYAGRHNKIPVTFRHILHRPAGNLVASGADLARLTRALLNRGQLNGVQLLPADVVDRMTASRSLEHVPVLPTHFGAGLQTWEWEGRLWHGHGGNVDGFSASLSYSPALGAGLVTLMNAGNAFTATDGVQQVVARYLTAQAGDEVAVPPAVVWMPQQWERVRGNYLSRCPRTTMLGFADRLFGWVRISKDANGVWEETSLHSPRAVVPVDGTRLRRADRSHPHLAFRPDGWLFSGTRCWQHVSTWRFWGEQLYVFGSIAWLLLALPLGLWEWLRKKGGPVAACAAVVGACTWMNLALVGTLRALYQFDPPLNVRTVGMWFVPLVLSGAAALGVALAARARHRRLPVAPLSASVCLVGLAGALWMHSWGVLGFAAWSF